MKGDSRNFGLLNTLQHMKVVTCSRARRIFRHLSDDSIIRAIGIVSGTISRQSFHFVLALIDAREIVTAYKHYDVNLKSEEGKLEKSPTAFPDRSS